MAKGIDRITMVSTGQGEVGASKLTNEVMDIIVKVPKMVHELTGIDISKIVKEK